MPINHGKIVSETCRAANCWFKATVYALGKKRRQRHPGYRRDGLE